MPYYKNTKTGQIVEWSAKHHSHVGDKKYWELTEDTAPVKKVAKKKAVRKKAKK
jgi:hypothetical protein